MIIKSFQVSLFVVVAMLVVTPAYATVSCGVSTDLGAGLVEIIVSTNEANFSGVAAATLVGTPVLPVESITTSNVAPFNQCTVADNSCTFQIQGTPGQGPQSWSRLFTDSITATPCMVNNTDGLPVELISFTVE